MQKSGILEKAKTLLDEAKIKVSDFALDFYYEQVVEYILNYCNIYELPEELNNTVIKMILNECQRAVISNEDGVSSISEGGRSVSFINKLDIIKDFDEKTKQVLNKFKVLYK